MAPTSVRIVVGTLVAVLMASAVYLWIVRGPAVLMDLASSIAAYCF